MWKCIISSLVTALIICGVTVASDFNTTPKQNEALTVIGEDERGLFRILTFKDHGRRCWIVHSSLAGAEIDCGR